jgi:hypothetical protein
MGARQLQTGGGNMPNNQQEQSTDDVWVQMCEAAELDPSLRLASRLAILQHHDALDCTLYRADESDPEAEEEDLGDAKVLFLGQYQAPVEWDEAASAEFYGEDAPERFFSAYIECAVKPASAQFFTAEPGDYLACMQSSGAVVMYYLYDYEEDERGRNCVLIRDDDDLA